MLFLAQSLLHYGDLSAQFLVLKLVLLAFAPAFVFVALLELLVLLLLVRLQLSDHVPGFIELEPEVVNQLALVLLVLGALALGFFQQRLQKRVFIGKHPIFLISRQ